MRHDLRGLGDKCHIHIADTPAVPANDRRYRRGQLAQLAAELERRHVITAIERQRDVVLLAVDFVGGPAAFDARACLESPQLIARGFPDDVELAADVDSIDVVPRWDTRSPIREFRPTSPR